MEDIDKAVLAQNWLMQYYRQWIPLDSCLALVRHINGAVEQPLAPDVATASPDDDPWNDGLDDAIIGSLP
jgi:hypothetical protein